MNVYIQCYDGKTLTLTTHPDATILTLRSQISEKLQIPVEKIILFRAKTYLFNTKMLSQYNIKNNNIIIMKDYKTTNPTGRPTFEQAFYFYKKACMKGLNSARILVGASLFHHWALDGPKRFSQALFEKASAKNSVEAK
jgi:TPR repeat protein